MQEIYSVVIIDDDTTSIRILVEELSVYSSLSILGTAENATDGRALLFKKRPELLFLDVELPEMTAMEFLADIQETITWNMQVVFYTSYSKYMIDAIRGSVFDYLQKPFRREELEVIIQRFFATCASSSHLSFREEVVQVLSGKDLFAVSTITGFQVLRIGQIGYLEYQGHEKIWKVSLSDGTSLQLKRGTSAETILKYNPAFVQISQSIIVNLHYIGMIQDKICKLCPPFDNRFDLLVSRKYQKNLQDRFSFI